jgi:hypothetical protein
MLVLGGDLFGGQIHEIDRYMENNLPTAAANIAHLITNVVQDLVSVCHPLGIEVAVTWSYGNHTRLRYEQAAQNTSSPTESWDYLIGTAVAAMIAPIVKRIYLPNSLLSLVKLNGLTVLCAHGDFLAKGGPPAQRLHKTMREFSANLAVKVDAAICGHFHHASSFESAFVTGSTKGTDAYAHHLILTQTRPSQALYRATLDGLTCETLYCDEASVSAPRYRARFTDTLSEPVTWTRASGPYVFDVDAAD